MSTLIKSIAVLATTFALACGGTANTSKADAPGATQKKSLTKFQGDRMEKAADEEE